MNKTRRRFISKMGLAGIVGGLASLIGSAEPIYAESSPQPEQTRGKIWYYNDFSRIKPYGWSTERDPEYYPFDGNTYESWGSERFPEVTAEKGRSFGPAFGDRCLLLLSKKPTNLPASLSQYIASPPSLHGMGQEVWFYIPRKTDFAEFIVASNICDGDMTAHSIAVKITYDGTTWRVLYECNGTWHDLGVSTIPLEQAVNRQWEMIRIVADIDINRYRYIQFMGKKYNSTTNSPMGQPLTVSGVDRISWNHYLQLSSRTGNYTHILLANYSLSYEEA